MADEGLVAKDAPLPAERRGRGRALTARPAEPEGAPGPALGTDPGTEPGPMAAAAPPGGAELPQLVSGAGRGSRCGAPVLPGPSASPVFIPSSLPSQAENLLCRLQENFQALTEKLTLRNILFGTGFGMPWLGSPARAGSLLLTAGWASALDSKFVYNE